MTKHTPGPWIVDKDAWHVCIEADKRLYCIASISDIGVAGRNREANANLIAASPDMLEALEGLIDLALICGAGHDNILISRAKAAIAKAEGR